MPIQSNDGKEMVVPLDISCDCSHIMMHDRLVLTFRHIFERHVRNGCLYRFVSYVFCVSPEIQLVNYEWRYYLNG